MKICAHCTEADWRKIEEELSRDKNDAKAWCRAIGIFECRMQERFFEPIRLLLNSDSPRTSSNCGEHSPTGMTPGFAVMALSCLVIDALQAFREGRDSENPAIFDCLRKQPATAKSFKDFLAGSRHFRSDFTRTIAGRFSQDVRNALLHNAETRKGWLIAGTNPKNKIVRKIGKGYVLNRTKFASALEEEFKDYVASLRKPSSPDIRQNFLIRMRSIARTAPAAE